jgi:hypothetical protein
VEGDRTEAAVRTASFRPMTTIKQQKESKKASLGWFRSAISQPTSKRPDAKNCWRIL